MKVGVRNAELGVGLLITVRYTKKREGSLSKICGTGIGRRADVIPVVAVSMD